MLPTNDLRERAQRIARQFTASQLLEVAAMFVEQADSDLDGAHPEMDFTVDLGDIQARLEMIAGQAEEARSPIMSRDQWQPSLSYAQAGLAS